MDGDSGSCNFNPESNCSKSTFFVGVLDASGLDFLVFSSLALRNKQSIVRTLEGGLEEGVDESLLDSSDPIIFDKVASWIPDGTDLENSDGTGSLDGAGEEWKVGPA